jgi:hypothetical protein
MQWSSLKKKVESFFATSVKGRVELRSTRYRSAHDQVGRGSITVDGKEVWSMGSTNFWACEYDMIQKIAYEQQLSPADAQIIAKTELEKDGILSHWDFYETLENYCNTSIDQSIASENILNQSLAVLDSRIGKRRLEKFNASACHPMVQYFYNLRCQAEGISLTLQSTGTLQS